MKDAFYFPHFCNARHDRKIRRVRKELGLEGYGIFFMLLEVLREQADYRYPIQDIDLLADELGTSEQKVRTVICNYDLFQVDSNEMFFSTNLIMYLRPYLEGKERKRISGIRGNLIRYKYITKEKSNEMNDQAILLMANKLEGFSLSDSLGSRLGIAIKGKESKQRKVNKSKVKENRTESPTARTFKGFQSSGIEKPERDYTPEYETHRNHWNSSGLPECRKLPVNIPNWGEVLNSMQLYTPEEITAAINNYSSIHEREKAITYTTFPNFLIKGIEKYADSAHPHETFKETQDENEKRVKWEAYAELYPEKAAEKKAQEAAK